MVAERLAIAALDLRAKAPWTPDMMFMSSTCFLPSSMIKMITSDIDNINSIEELRTCMDGCRWSYWDGYGSGLWTALQAAKIELGDMINQRHLETLAKQKGGRDKKREEQEQEEQRKDEEETRAKLAAIGLDKVKRVKLVVSPDTPDTAGPSFAITDPQYTVPGPSNVLITDLELNTRHSKVLRLLDSSMPPELFYAATSSRKHKLPSATSQISTSPMKRSKKDENQQPPAAHTHQSRQLRPLTAAQRGH
ncbi:hypothetical protein FIBSPDRAFT_853012 [Athelia psychrophila]|uniref:Uncharacterized protein n=1 Tax=Athelia psychrophila TaxID=1759441 RepID=A0A166REX3_9AGAM|nr:hypothetical protein FIBSPDRAFT_853012 [Fibularhizoctonia sp. CBS 109695]